MRGTVESFGHSCGLGSDGREWEGGGQVPGQAGPRQVQANPGRAQLQPATCIIQVTITQSLGVWRSSMRLARYVLGFLNLKPAPREDS